MDQIRVKRSESTWRELFSRQAASGVSVAEFCRAEGINAGVFRRRRAVLIDGQVDERKMQLKSERAMGAAPFIDLGGIGAASPRTEVRLELGGGVVLTVARG